MKHSSIFSQPGLLALACVAGCSPSMPAQAPPNQHSGKAMAENKAALRQDTFKQRTEVSTIGEVKSVRLDQVRFGLGGNLERTLLTCVAAEVPKARGFQGKVVAKKGDELANYVERLRRQARRNLAPRQGDLEKLSRQAEFWSGQGATDHNDVARAITETAGNDLEVKVETFDYETLEGGLR